MNVFLTGGSGDLGSLLAGLLKQCDGKVIRYDIQAPRNAYGHFIEGSILDRDKLQQALNGTDVIVHIAAWHGYHEFIKAKTLNEFWDLNVTGTFNVFQAAQRAGIKKLIFISSESVSDMSSVYGWTKRMSEEIVQRYVDQYQMNVITLRPRAFIPSWNRAVYPSFVLWLKWYWKGAVHIQDVAQAVIQSIDLLNKQALVEHLILTIDGAYEYTENDLQYWDQAGSGSSFKKYYSEFENLVAQYGLDPTLKPTCLDISEAKRWLGYNPSYSLRTALAELAQYGESGPDFDR